MKSKALTGMCFLLVVSCGGSLSVESVGTHKWESESISAQTHYYQLSDQSLQFIKLSIPGMNEYTLPRSVSASGARYTQEMDIVWWEKGDSAFVQLRNINGDWETAYTFVTAD